MTNIELIQNYKTWLQDQAEKSENTIKNYQLDIEIFAKWYNRNLLTATKQDIEDFKSFMLNKRKWSSSTRNRRVISLRGFYQYLEDEGLIKENPTEKVIIPKVPERQPEYLTESEAIRLVKTTETQEEPLKSRDKAIIVLFLTTGLRLSELTNIKLQDINENTLRVIGKGDKERLVNLNPDTLEAIECYLQVRYGNSNQLFLTQHGKPMTKQAVQYTIKKYIRLAGLDEDRYSVHKLRHTAATIMHQNGTDIRTIQGVLGHKHVSTTEIYTHIDKKQLEQAANATQGLFA